MKFVGAHVSAAGGVENSPVNANKIGAKAFALFTKNQRQWLAKPLTPESISAFKENCRKFGYDAKHILPHDSYLINLGSPTAEALDLSRKSFNEEMMRCQLLGLSMLNFHPGAHVKLVTEDVCIRTIAESVNIALDESEGVTAVIENTAGQGSAIGYKFEHLRDIMALVRDQSRVGVCLDTCHTFTAGYDLVSEEGYRETFDQFEKIVGFRYLRGIHLNDSKKARGTRVDRHENLDTGLLGRPVFERIMKDPRFDDIPIILETPDETLWEKEIAWLYSLAGN